MFKKGRYQRQSVGVTASGCAPCGILNSLQGIDHRRHLILEMFGYTPCDGGLFEHWWTVGSVITSSSLISMLTGLYRRSCLKNPKKNRHGRTERVHGKNGRDGGRTLTMRTVADSRAATRGQANGRVLASSWGTYASLIRASNLGSVFAIFDQVMPQNYVGERRGGGWRSTV